MSPGAVEIAEEMKQVVDLEGWDHEGGEQHKFGIGCRTNKELKGYAFELLIQGLPYYSKNDLLDSATMLAPIDLMSVKSSNPVLRAKALFNAHRHLNFFIDKVFNEKVEREITAYRAEPTRLVFKRGIQSGLLSKSS